MAGRGWRWTRRADARGECEIDRSSWNTRWSAFSAPSTWITRCFWPARRLVRRRPDPNTAQVNGAAARAMAAACSATRPVTGVGLEPAVSLDTRRAITLQAPDENRA